MPPLLANQIQMPNINPVAAAAQGQADATNMRSAQMQQYEAGLQMLASAGLSALGGDLNGEPDPETWNRALDDLGGILPGGMDMEQYRDPEMARSFAFRSLEAMRMAQQQQSYELALKQFEHEITMDALELSQGPGAQSPLGKLASDYRNGLIDEETYRAGVEEATDTGSLVNVNLNEGALSPGQEAIDKGFAETYLTWRGGASADSQAQINNLTNALDLLESGQASTGNLESTLPREIRAFISPDGLIAQEGVEETVQRSLREILGAQFTEKEGERLIQRAFNPLLPPEENIRRVKLLLGKMQEMAASKDAMAAYFDENGTLRGYQGRVPSMNEYLAVETQFGPDPETATNAPEGELPPAPEGITADEWPALYERMSEQERALFR